MDQGVTSPYGHMREYVFSRTLADDIDPNVTVVSEDPRGEVRRLKAQEGGLGICLFGGPTIAGEPLPEIDALLIKRHPIVAGAGRSLFEGSRFDPAPFTRVEGTVFEGGADYTLFHHVPSCPPV